MRSVVVASALCGLAAAAPRPQQINAAAISLLPTPSVLGPELAATATPAITYNPSVAAASVAAALFTSPPTTKKRSTFKRSACDPQPGGEGPVPGDGSVSAYLDGNSILAQAALGAATPSGYTKNFENLQGSTQQIGYLTYKTLGSTYDVQGCADFCDSENFCLGFNIYYERDPSVDAADACPNPPPITNIKCSLYGYPVASLSATNTGQWRGPQDASGESFHVVIAGSNGYSKDAPVRTPPSLTDFTGPVALPAAINAPNEADSYNGMKLYNEGPFDPSICAAACEAQTVFDKEHLVDENGNYRPCNFFNAYILTKNDVPQGTYCSFYTQVWDPSYAVNTGYFYGDDVYKVVSSFSYSLTTQDSGHVQTSD